MKAVTKLAVVAPELFWEHTP